MLVIVVPTSGVSVRVDVVLAFEATSTHLQVLWSGLRNSRFLGFVLPSDMSRNGGSSAESSLLLTIMSTLPTSFGFDLVSTRPQVDA